MHAACSSRRRSPRLELRQRKTNLTLCQKKERVSTIELIIFKDDNRLELKVSIEVQSEEAADSAPHTQLAKALDTR